MFGLGMSVLTASLQADEMRVDHVSETIDIYTPITTISEETQESVVYTEPVNPCYKGEDLGYMHEIIDNDWTCTTCKTYIGPRYGFTDDEVFLLAQLLCGGSEVSGDGEYDFVWDAVTNNDIRYDQIYLVLCVVMNRVRSDEFPDKVTDVVMQGPPKYVRQFTVMPRNASKKPHELAIKYVRDWCEAYDRWEPGIQSIPETHLYFKMGKNSTNVSSEGW